MTDKTADQARRALLVNAVNPAPGAPLTTDAERVNLLTPAPETSTSYGTVVSTALRDSRVMSWGFIDRLFDVKGPEDRDSISKGWSYSAVAEDVEAGKDAAEVAYLRENGVRGAGSLDRALAIIQNRREDDAVYAKASGPALFLGQMTAGMADPTALFLGLGIGAVASRGLGIGAGRFVRAGRPGAAFASAVGENVAGELAFTALQDASGEVLGFEDYATAVAGAVVLGGAFSYGTYRAAAEVSKLDSARRLAQEARDAADAAMKADNVDTTDSAHVSAWREENARKVMEEMKKTTDVRIIPDDLGDKLKVLHDDPTGTGEPEVTGPDGKVEEPKVPPPEPPTDPEEPVGPQINQPTPEQVLRVAQELLDTGNPVAAEDLLSNYVGSTEYGNLLDGTRRQVEDLLRTAGQEVGKARDAEAFNASAANNSLPALDSGVDPVLFTAVQTQDSALSASAKIYGRRGAKQLAGKGNWVDTSLNDVLDTALADSSGDWGVLKPLMIHMRAWTEKIGGTPTITIAQLPADKLAKASGWSSANGEMLIPAQQVGNGDTVRGAVAAFGPWQRSTLVHEAAHAMTQHVIAAYVNNPSKLAPEVRGAVRAIEEVFESYVRDLGPMDQAPRALQYSMNNLDEFVAETMSNTEVMKKLLSMPATPSWGGKYSNALNTVIQAVKKALAFGLDRTDTAYDQMMAAVDTLYRARESIQTGVLKTGGRPTARPAPSAPTRDPLDVAWWGDPAWLSKWHVGAETNPLRQLRWSEMTEGLVRDIDSALDLQEAYRTGAPDKRGRPTQQVSTTDSVKKEPLLYEAINAVEQLAAKYLEGDAVVLGLSEKGSAANGSMTTFGGTHMIVLNVDLAVQRHGASAAQHLLRTAIHEVGHAVYHKWARELSPDQLADLVASWDVFMREADSGWLPDISEAISRRWGLTSKNRGFNDKDHYTSSGGKEAYFESFDEYSAEQFVKFIESRSEAKDKSGLSGIARSLIANLMAKMRAFWGDYRARLHVEPDDSFVEFFDMIQQGVLRNSIQQASPSVRPGPTAIDPIATVGARRKFAKQQYEHARQVLSAFPINKGRLRVLTARMGGAISDGLVLARSMNPILNTVAMFVTETTTGAAGRRANVALRKHALQGLLIGNSRLDFETHYLDWRNRNGGGTYEDLVKGDVRNKFERLVYEEILHRKLSTDWRSSDAPIAKAADAAEALFERSLKAQKEAGTLGSDRLPKNSRGYVPQALDGSKLAQATTEELDGLAEHLATHWVTVLGWDAKFSRRFADFYIQRARDRTMNPNSKDFSAAGSEGAGLIREALDEMMSQSRDPDLIEQARKSSKGLGQTKRRLDVDLLGTLPSGKRVLDFYESDTSKLMLRYVNRTAGTVALTEFGIPGLDGVKHLRDAATLYSERPEEIPTKDEMDAFDRVMAEILGAPVPGQVHSTNAASVRLLVMLQRLGGMAWTQAAETVNAVHMLGLGSALKNISGLPKALSEVGRLKKGLPTQDRLLTHLEQWGGEFGSFSYKMNFPLDPPDDRVNTYVDDPGVLHRLLSAGAYYQSKLSGFRAIHAAQHRMMAEQVVMKAARYIRDGGQADKWLADMGFTEELIGVMRAHIDDIAKWDKDGRLVSFDINQLPDSSAKIAVSQAVHRGVNQIIQGTFIGERGAWAHNDYVALLTQLRTFSLTSMEKQWARVREVTGGGKEGYAAAAMVLVAQMALVAPLYAARVHFYALGREDREEFIKKNLSPENLVRGVLNYTAMSGLLGDMLDVLAGLAGGWGEDYVGGARQGQGQGRISDAVPAVGTVDGLSRVVTGNATVYQALKQMPGANLPFLIPIINLTK